jgi:hypothetical protein
VLILWPALLLGLRKAHQPDDETPQLAESETWAETSGPVPDPGAKEV